MLSILIPVYNHPVLTLVEELCRQCDKLAVEYEVICLDDHSESQIRNINQALKEREHVVYEELQENTGRSKIRNRLALMAHHSWLLYLDNDGVVISGQFIQNYLNAIRQNPNAGVFYGGTVYSSEKPAKSFMLHWTYGHQLEAPGAEIRSARPWETFKTNNFLIRADIMGKISFDEKIRGYGYEDLVFANSLKINGFAIFHLPNPVLHTGLDDNKIFLEKTKDSLKNLSYLHQSAKIGETRLIRYWRQVQGLLQIILVGSVESQFEKYLYKQLLNGNNNLKLLNLWKLIIFHMEQKSLPKIR
ncbi:MAG: glycosyltransferase family 2 protein [Saprospiraceae bacterium]|nr:glycosyltransferase family 2 protein [Saprospiraceae bacterium]